MATPALQLLDYGTRYYYYLGIRAQIVKSKAKIPLEKIFELIAMGIQAGGSNRVSRLEIEA